MLEIVVEGLVGIVGMDGNVRYCVGWEYSRPILEAVLQGMVGGVEISVEIVQACVWVRGRIGMRSSVGWCGSWVVVYGCAAGCSVGLGGSVWVCSVWLGGSLGQCGVWVVE